jgi:hypothetical protein
MFLQTKNIQQLTKDRRTKDIYTAKKTEADRRKVYTDGHMNSYLLQNEHQI